jgi:hypothetical protein
MFASSDRILAAQRGRTWIALRGWADLDELGAVRRWLTVGAAGTHDYWE